MWPFHSELPSKIFKGDLMNGDLIKLPKARVCRRLFPLRGWSNGQARESCEVFA